MLFQISSQRSALHFLAIWESGGREWQFAVEPLGGVGAYHHGSIGALGFVFALLPKTFNGGDYTVPPHLAIVIPYWFIAGLSGAVFLECILARRKKTDQPQPDGDPPGTVGDPPDNSGTSRRQFSLWSLMVAVTLMALALAVVQNYFHGPEVVQLTLGALLGILILVAAYCVLVVVPLVTTVRLAIRWNSRSAAPNAAGLVLRFVLIGAILFLPVIVLLVWVFTVGWAS
jgi:hypothetical protein